MTNDTFETKRGGKAKKKSYAEYPTKNSEDQATAARPQLLSLQNVHG